MRPLIERRSAIPELDPTFVEAIQHADAGSGFFMPGTKTASPSRRAFTISTRDRLAERHGETSPRIVSGRRGPFDCETLSWNDAHARQIPRRLEDHVLEHLVLQPCARKPVRVEL